MGGFDRVYEIGRIFRNEGMDTQATTRSSPRVELYQAYTDFNGMMDLFEELLSSAAQKILGTYQVEWQGEQIDLTPGWPRINHGGRGQEVSWASTLWPSTATRLPGRLPRRPG